MSTTSANNVRKMKALIEKGIGQVKPKRCKMIEILQPGRLHVQQRQSTRNQKACPLNKPSNQEPKNLSARYWMQNTRLSPNRRCN